MRKIEAVLAGGLMSGMVLAGCGLPPEPGQGESNPDSGRPAITAETIFDARGECVGRREKVNLKLGEMSVLGQYEDEIKGGWEITYSGEGALTLKETVDDAQTRISTEFTPGFEISDVKHDTTETLTIPPVLTDSAVAGSMVIARYIIDGNSVMRGKSERNGESGQFALSIIPGQVGYVLTNETTYSDRERRVWC